MIRDLDIRALRSFVAVAEHGNVTSAAHQRSLTQSAVSQQIKKLEGHIGCALLKRSSTGVTLTAAGKQLVPLARRSIAHNDEILIELGNTHVGAHIRLGVAHDLVSTLLPTSLSAFHQKNPTAEVVLVSASSARLIAMLNSGDIDLAITTDTHDVPDAQFLFASQLVWIGAKGGTAYELNPLPIAVSTQECPFRQALAATLQIENRAWKPMTQRGSLEAMFAMLKADLAISALLPETIPSDLAPVPDGFLPKLPEFFIHLRQPLRNLTQAEHLLHDTLSGHLASDAGTYLEGI